MNTKELEDLSRYFRLSDYRDGEYFLLEEYEELEEIVKRNPIAKELEEARYKCIKGKISEEEYKEICNNYFSLINKNKKEKTKI